jgi:hypothetical protein
VGHERIPQEVLNMKLKGEYRRGRPRSRWEQQVRKDGIQKEGRTWRKSSGRQIDAVIWLLDNQLIVERPEKEGNVVTPVFQTWRLLAYAPELPTNSSDNRGDVFVCSVLCYSKR